MRSPSVAKTSGSRQSVGVERAQSDENFDRADGVLRGSLIGLLLWLAAILIASPYFVIAP